MLFFPESCGFAATPFDLDQNQVDLARSIGLNARQGDPTTQLGGAREVDGSVIALAWKGAAPA